MHIKNALLAGTVASAVSLALAGCGPPPSEDRVVYWGSEHRTEDGHLVVRIFAEDRRALSEIGVIIADGPPGYLYFVNIRGCTVLLDPPDPTPVYENGDCAGVDYATHRSAVEEVFGDRAFLEDSAVVINKNH